MGQLVRQTDALVRAFLLVPSHFAQTLCIPWLTWVCNRGGGECFLSAGSHPSIQGVSHEAAAVRSYWFWSFGSCSCSDRGCGYGHRDRDGHRRRRPLTE